MTLFIRLLKDLDDGATQELYRRQLEELEESLPNDVSLFKPALPMPAVREYSVTLKYAADFSKDVFQIYSVSQ